MEKLKSKRPAAAARVTDTAVVGGLMLEQLELELALREPKRTPVTEIVLNLDENGLTNDTVAVTFVAEAM